MEIVQLLIYVRRRLGETRGRWKEIAVAAGVSYSTLAKIAHGVYDDPRVNAVQRLANWFAAEGARQPGEVMGEDRGEE